MFVIVDETLVFPDMRLAEHFTESITSVLDPSSDDKGQNMVPRLFESFAFILTLMVVSSWAEVGVVQLMAVVGKKLHS